MPTTFSKWTTPLIGLVATSILSFSVWAATSIYSLKASIAVQQETITHQSEVLSVQQAQIATFQNILGDIKADVRVIRAIMEERDRDR